jgi:hypothetical protein
MANPWDDPSLESETTKKIKAGTARIRKEGLNKPTPPAKKVGEIGATDAWGKMDELKRQREKTVRLAKPATDIFQKLKLKEK